MKLIRKLPRSSRSGWALVFSMFAVFIAATTAALMLTTSLTADRSAATDRSRLEARYCADGAIEVARREIASAIANWGEPPAEGSAEINGVEVAYTIVPTGFDATFSDPSGIQTNVEGYQIEAVAEVRGHQVRSHRIVNAESTPIFQFAVFYDGDLEIFPGPDMELGGRVHTNGDMYVGSGATLTVNTNYFRAAGQMFRSRKGHPEASPGTVLVRRWVEDPFDPSEPEEYFPMLSQAQLAFFGVPSVSGYDSRFTEGWDAEGDGDFMGSNDFLPWSLGAVDNWQQAEWYASGAGATVQSTEHGMTSAVAPQVGSISMFEEVEGGSYELDEDTGEFVEVPAGEGTHEKGFFHRTAGLTLVTHEDGSFTARNSLGFDVTDALAGVVRVTSMFDARQGGDIVVTEVDVSALNRSGLFPSNGLLYGASYGNGTGAELRGLKLVNGAELAGPLTVASEGGVYVQGDYNTTNKVGASVIADAVNLLSNNWNDTKVPLSLPIATDTTYNLAFISGNQETTVGAYNGGFENLPRFHENWGGRNCNIMGSMVNAWTSGYADGAWVYGDDRYQAPRRNWSYDTAFNNIAALPPYTPMVVTAEDVVSW